MASTATAQDTAPAAIPQQAEAGEGEIVVVGVRQSLEKAATIKREALQVVDSIVADDIGKFPDPTTAAALQRVPGVQVQVGANNEIVNVRIRGLDDILSTLNGREIFSTTGRGFALQDLPAVALARVDVIKSSTANLIEGGIAGITDLQLNRPFNFNEPTIVATVRGNYSQNVEKLNPQVGLLLSDRWDTGIGEIGALVGMSYAYFDYDRPVSFVGERRSYATQFGLPGVMGPLNFGAISNYGNYRRPQANASVQWQATPELQVYADGLFTGYRSEFQSVYQATPFFNPETRISDVVVDEDKCILARVGPNQGNPTAAQLAAGNYTVQNLCNLESATFTNVRLNSSTQARTQQVDNYLGAIGFKYDNGVTKIDFDAAYQKSMSDYSQVIVDVGKRITVILDTDQNGGGAVEQPGNPAADPNGFFLRNGLNEQFDQSRGELWQARVDATHDLEGRLGFLDSLQVGLRFADRSALFQSALVTRGAPGGDLATPVAGNLPAGFLVPKPGVDRANGGAEGLAPDPDFLRSEYGRSVLRALYGLSPGQPAFQDDRRFEATERTYASYVQLGYKATLGGPIEIDGLVGVRPTKTERTIQGAGLVNGVAVPQSADTSDVDVLPNASARIQFGGGLQARFSYAKAIRRPEFSSLNPGLTYVLTTNPNERNSGSGGNPDLRPQISDSYDATLEYYFGSSFVAVAGFYRDIKDRVVTQAQDETLDGTLFSIRRPRNIGTAQLKGVEISGQTFFDFLPGPLAGFGAFGNFTYIDSEIGGDDVLRGLPILQVSKYNFNTGLLYDRNGISARLVYTYRSRYYDGDATGSNTLRDFDESNIDDRNVNPTVLTYVRPAGRLDFSVGYDLNEMLRVDIGGSNILRNKYKSYYNAKYMNVDFRDDDSVYTVGLRAKF
ncbi:TonB-dependent receptor [Sphingomonas sp. ac-8]|uniref:TonB-dependent receptor n=1 Tax=Sphingomonas sp. ac-8 TaxID=3242977 RepID=UPI003A80D1AB